MGLWFHSHQPPVCDERLSHIAFIMDGNGRWAKKRNLPRTAGHAKGAEVFQKLTEWCKELGIRYLTVYAFSTENWKRPKEEVDVIMKLVYKYVDEVVIKKIETDKKFSVKFQKCPLFIIGGFLYDQYSERFY